MWRNDAIRGSPSLLLPERGYDSILNLSGFVQWAGPWQVGKIARNLPIAQPLPISFENHDFQVFGRIFRLRTGPVRRQRRLRPRTPCPPAFGRAAAPCAHGPALESAVDRRRRAHARKRLRLPWKCAAIVLRTRAQHARRRAHPFALDQLSERRTRRARRSPRRLRAARRTGSRSAAPRPSKPRLVRRRARSVAPRTRRQNPRRLPSRLPLARGFRLRGAPRRRRER